MAPGRRKTSFYGRPKQRGLRWHLAAIGVEASGELTRDHIHRAQRIFRGARGQREVNDLWNVIKRYVCAGCENIKWRPTAHFCSIACLRKNTQRKKRNNLTTVNQNSNTSTP